ncbi:hypothetical protein CSB69_1745 [Morganella morganii]|nr:hypothetical protein CSB69_1745 [Morganella morganii]EMP53671.1 hypothetical protein C790_00189 [Morganella morganii SC01]
MVSPVSLSAAQSCAERDRRLFHQLLLSPIPATDTVKIR